MKNTFNDILKSLKLKDDPKTENKPTGNMVRLTFQYPDSTADIKMQSFFDGISTAVKVANKLDIFEFHDISEKDQIIVITNNQELAQKCYFKFTNYLTN